MSATRVRASTYAMEKGHQQRARAEEQVFAYLERRWRDKLPSSGKLPRAMRRRMKNDAHFQLLVGRVLAGQDLADDDREQQPDVVERVDGKVVDRVVDELGADPRAYTCPGCGDEREQPSGLCAACADFNSKHGD